MSEETNEKREHALLSEVELQRLWDAVLSQPPDNRHDLEGRMARAVEAYLHCRKEMESGLRLEPRHGQPGASGHIPDNRQHPEAPLRVRIRRSVREGVYVVDFV